MSTRRLVLIRHGQTEYNATGRMQGQLDTDLSPTGIAQARAASAALADWNVSAVFASDLRRAADTAEILAKPWGVPVVTDARLRETHLGKWTGASHEEIDRNYPGQRPYWKHDPQWAPPEAETRVQVARRAHAVVKEAMESSVFDDGLVVMVAHGGTIGALTAQLLDLPMSHFPMFSGLGNVHWSQLIAYPAFESAGAQSSSPAVDGSQVPLLPSVRPDWWKSPQWRLEGWNLSASPEQSPVSTASPDEGGDDVEEAGR